MPRFLHPTPSAVLLGLALLAAAAGAQPAPVPLAVERLAAAPSGQIDLIVHSDAAAALASGSFRLEAADKDGAGAQAFGSVVSATAFSTAGDATASAVLDVPTQTIDVSFASASGTLNEAFGPLVVVRLELAAGLVEDQRFDLRIVPGTIDLRSPADEPVPAVAARGRLRLRTPVAGEADLGPTGAEAVPGTPAVFGAVTGRPFPIGSGTFEILYDPAVTTASPVVAFDPRYGEVIVDSLSEPEPGRILVTFHSPGGALNSWLYGRILSVTAPTHGDIEIGVLSPVDLGPATALYDAEGNPYLWEAEGSDFIDFVPADLVLRVGFEEGDLFDWTEATN